MNESGPAGIEVVRIFGPNFDKFLLSFLLSGLRKGWRLVELQTEILNGETREHE